MKNNRFIFPISLPIKVISIPRHPKWYWQQVEQWAKDTDAHDLLFFSKIVNYSSIIGIGLIALSSFYGWFLPPMTTSYQIHTNLVTLKLLNGDQLPALGPQVFKVSPTGNDQNLSQPCRQAKLEFRNGIVGSANSASPNQLTMRVTRDEGKGLRLSIDQLTEQSIAALGTLICIEGKSFPSFFSLEQTQIGLATESPTSEILPIDILRIKGRVIAFGRDSGSGVFERGELPMIQSGRIEAKVPTWPFRSGEIKTEALLSPLDAVSFWEEINGSQTEALSALSVAPSESGLLVSGFVIADDVVVKRYGLPEGASIKLKPTLLHRLQAQEEWLLLLGLFLSLQFLRTSWEAYVRSFWVQSVSVPAPKISRKSNE